MTFSEVPSRFDPPSEEKRILEFWDQNDIYAKSLERRRGASPLLTAKATWKVSGGR
jgi:isoleucyl-tRNA synthetase